MTRLRSKNGVLVVAAAALSCGPAATQSNADTTLQTQPEVENEPVAREESNAETPDLGTEDPQPEEEAASGGQPPTEPPSGPSVAELCRNRCERLRSKCNERLADNCQANCKSYVGLAQTCEAPVRTALICATEASDLICADVAPQSCEKAFKNVASCGSGATSEEPKAGEALKVPDGWRVQHDAALGFRVPLPAGAERKSEGPRRFLSVTDAAGNRYIAGVEPAIAPEVNDKTLLRSVRSFVLPCELNLKLHGRYETDGVTAVRFDAGCKDGSAWHGMLRVAGDKMYPVAVKSAPGQKPGPELESMIYGFELDKR